MYSIEQLSVTNQQLISPNLPNQSYQIDNLNQLSQVLDLLNKDIGPFQVISGFRTKELQEKLSAQGEPTGTGSMSFHEVGRAVDIAPTSMSINDYFGRILADPYLRSLFAEIAVKPSQNTLHLAINVAGDLREPKITGLSSAGSYVRLSLDEIANYIKPFVSSIEDAYASASLVTYNRTPLILTAVAAFGGALYLYFGLKRKTA